MNAQIAEDYVSFGVAKLLKEKGFDIECSALYDRFHEDLPQVGFEPQNFNNGTIRKDIVSAPTLQMARKWLRLIHSIDISITPDRVKNYTALVFVNKELPFTSIGSFKTYEKACEAAIKYCLENLGEDEN